MFNRMFGGQAAPAAPTPQQQPAAAVAKDQIKPDGMNPSNPNAAGVANPENPDSGKPAVNPLDSFKDLYKIDTVEGSANIPTKLEISDEVINNVLPSLDFTSGLSPETKQAVTNGDGAAILQAMQQVGAEAYKTAMQHNSAVLNPYLDQRFEAFQPTIADSVNAKMTSGALASMPNADNPVIKAELERVSSQLRKKFPSADPSWVAKQANTYLTELGSQLTPKPTAAEQQAALPQSVDFAELLRSDE